MTSCHSMPLRARLHGCLTFGYRDGFKAPARERLDRGHPGGLHQAPEQTSLYRSTRVDESLIAKPPIITDTSLEGENGSPRQRSEVMATKPKPQPAKRAVTDEVVAQAIEIRS